MIKDDIASRFLLRIKNSLGIKSLNPLAGKSSKYLALALNVEFFSSKVMISFLKKSRFFKPLTKTLSEFSINNLFRLIASSKEFLEKPSAHCSSKCLGARIS